MKFLRPLAVLLIFLAAGPACAARSPAWTKGSDPKFPESKYMVGVGIGPNIESARANARAEIARVFQARVQQTVTDVQSETSQSLGKRRGPAAGQQSSTTNTQVSTEALLEGVVIKETWFDKKAKNHYALAVLDKTAVQRSLTTRIVPLEEPISQRRAEAAQSQDPLVKARALSQARMAAVERDTLAARRQLVDPAGMADLGADMRPQIDKDLNAALSRIRAS